MIVLVLHVKTMALVLMELKHIPVIVLELVILDQIVKEILMNVKLDHAKMKENVSISMEDSNVIVKTAGMGNCVKMTLMSVLSGHA